MSDYLKNSIHLCRQRTATNMVKTNLKKILTTIVALLATIIIVASAESYALDSKIMFEHITSTEGLSHDTVYSIVQDKEGYIWFGTEDGLNKYDGYKLETYRGEQRTDSIGNSNCAFLYVDDSNSIWIASWGGGIEVLDQTKRTVKTYINDPADPESISDNSIQHIFQDSSGTLWFGTYKNGLNRFDKDSGKFKSYSHIDNNTNSISDNRVWWISEDLDGSLLIGTNKGLDKFDPDTETFTHYSQITSRVRTIYFDSNNNLWLGTQNGLCKFDTATGENQYYLHDENNPKLEVITSIFEDSNGNFWVGSSDGINLLDRATGSFELYKNNPYDEESISNNDIRVILEDNSGNLWVGTRGGGVNKIDIKPKKFHFYNSVANNKITLSDNDVLSVLYSVDEVLWVGTNNGGLNKFDLKNGTQEYFLTDITKEENRNLTAISEGTDSFWVGSLGGLNRIDKQTGEIITYKNDGEIEGTISHDTILSLLYDSMDTLWVGTLGGLNKYDAKNKHFINYLFDMENMDTISNDTIYCLYEDSNNNLWVGTAGGLNLFERESGKFTRFVYDKNNPKGISDNIIYCITEDLDNNLWIGTQYGLNRLDRETNQFTSYTTADGLPNNGIRGIRSDASGRLWISTNNGISRLDYNEMQFTNYNVLDGLQGNNYNINATEIMNNGQILFGGTKGLDFIDPSKIEKSKFLPQIVITGFRVMDKEYDYRSTLSEKGKIELNYKENHIWVEVSSLDYTAIKRNQYAYMLEGFDEKWIYSSSQNFINYTNLPSGDFVLRIKGTNYDGVWNEEGISIPIEISPPWWLSLFAKFIYACVILLLIYGLIRYSISKQKKRSENLSKMLNQTINAMSRIGEIRDTYTAGHQRRVQTLSVAIATEMGLPQEQINNIYFGSLIHDIGKINISSDYLNKPGKLSDLEFKIIQTHVMSGQEIIKEIEFPEEVSAIITQHHERMDGSGYPNGISGDQLMLGSRIVAVADVVEAMSTDRPYRPALGIDAAIEEITKYKGSKFDGKVVDICVKLLKDKGFKFTD